MALGSWWLYRIGKSLEEGIKDELVKPLNGIQRVKVRSAKA